MRSRNLGRSTPYLDDLTDYQLRVFSPVFAKGAEGSLRIAQLQRSSGSPLFFAAKNRPLRNYITGDTAEHERFIHKVATTHNHRLHHRRGILPYMGSFVQDIPSGRPETYHAMPLCEAILQDCLPAIINLQTSAITVFHHVIHRVLSDIVSGLGVLAGVTEPERGIVHNDLNLINIGLYKMGWVIYDFSQAEFYSEFSAPQSHPRGSPAYISPETLANDKRFPFAKDIWAFGQIMRQLLGQDMRFQETLTTVGIDEHYKILIATYIKLREAQRQSPQPETNHQEALLGNLLRQTTFPDCLQVLTNAMLEILPECRPDLATLQKACAHLASLLPEEHHINDIVSRFYTSLHNESLINLPAQPSPGPDMSGACDDGGDCVVDLVLSSPNTAPSSPVFFPQANLDNTLPHGAVVSTQVNRREPFESALLQVATNHS
jgi:serine/threonine protein kinase